MQPKSPLPANWDVPQVFRDRLGEQAGRQRAMFADGHLLLVLHEPPTADHGSRGARLFWRSPDGTWKSKAIDSAAPNLRGHVDEFVRAVDALEQEEESALRADEYDVLMNRTTPLVRCARNLYATLQEARELVGEDRDLIICRDQAYNVQRAAELLSSEVQNGLQCAIARRVEEQAESSHRMALAGHRLNLLAAIFLPLATIASIFGMNLRLGVEDMHTPWPFVIAVGVGVVSGFLLRASMASQSNRSP